MTMTMNTSVVVLDDATQTRTAVAGFLAGYCGATRRSYATDLRIFAAWCGEARLELFAVRRGHLRVPYARPGPQRAGRLAGPGRPRLSTRPRPRLPAGAQRPAHLRGPGRRHRRPGVPAWPPHAQDPPQGGKHAVIPLAPRTSRAIDLYIGERTTGPIFVGAKGGRMDRYAADRMVKRLARRAGITKRISPHSLRHSFITAALDAGVPLRDVQEAASHADPRTTMRYDRGRGSLDRHATYVVATFLAGASR